MGFSVNCNASVKDDALILELNSGNSHQENTTVLSNNDVHNPYDSQNAQQIDRFVQLNFSNLGLTIFPAHICNYKNLRIVDLTKNKLSNLSKQIAELKNLSCLFLSDNQLKALPDEICSLKMLERICLANNQLITLPEDLGKLENLKSINLEKNRLTTLPASIDSYIQNIGVILQQTIWIGLDENPCLFMMNKDFSGDAQAPQRCLSRSLIKYICCKNYICITPLASFCHKILFEKNVKLLKDEFHNLPAVTRIEISAKVKQIRMQQVPLLPTKNLYALAMLDLFKKWFSELSEEQKNVAYRHVENIAGYEAGERSQTEERSWGEDHAEDNILRLIDAFVLATQPNGRKLRRYN